MQSENHAILESAHIDRSESTFYIGLSARKGVKFATDTDMKYIIKQLRSFKMDVLSKAVERFAAKASLRPVGIINIFNRV